METLHTVTDKNVPDRRVRIVADTEPEQPLNDGAAPIVFVSYERSGWHAETIDQTFSKDVYAGSKAVEAAAEHFCGGGYDGRQPRGPRAWDRLERYLRLYHGCTGVDIADMPWGTYISYDPAEVRERWGLTDEYLADHPDIEPADMGEYRAYLNGECYGIVAEKRERWLRLGKDVYFIAGRLYDVADVKETWVEDESLWGLFGDLDGYVMMRATELL